MKDWIDGLTDLAAIKGDEAVLRQGLADYTDSFGFSGYAYLHIQPSLTVAISNYHPDWRSTYSAQRLILVDPVIRRAKSIKRAFTWSGNEDRHQLSKEECAFFDRASHYGIRSGITVPIKAAHGSISIFTLASEASTLHLSREIDAVAAAAAVGQLHARVSMTPVPDAERYPAWLDPKEAAYLHWISVGKTMDEAADLEGVKYNSVKSKLEEARKRLDVHTMPHLVATAIRARLI